MRPFLTALTLILPSACPVAEAQAHDLLGLHAGMTAGEAVGILSKYADVEKINEPGIGVTYIGSKYAVTLCGNSNIVGEVDHFLGPEFSEFSKSVKSEEAANGTGNYRIFSGDEKTPFEAIEISWKPTSGEIYSVSFTSFGSSSRVSESLFKECA